MLVIDVLRSKQFIIEREILQVIYVLVPLSNRLFCKPAARAKSGLVAQAAKWDHYWVGHSRKLLENILIMGWLYRVPWLSGSPGETGS